MVRQQCMEGDRSWSMGLADNRMRQCNICTDRNRKQQGELWIRHREMEQELYRWLDENSGKRMTYLRWLMIKTIMESWWQTGKRCYMYWRSTSRHCWTKGEKELDLPSTVEEELIEMLAVAERFGKILAEHLHERAKPTRGVENRAYCRSMAKK